MRPKFREDGGVGEEDVRRGRKRTRRMRRGAGRKGGEERKERKEYIARWGVLMGLVAGEQRLEAAVEDFSLT